MFGRPDIAGAGRRFGVGAGGSAMGLAGAGRRIARAEAGGMVVAVRAGVGCGSAGLRGGTGQCGFPQPGGPGNPIHVHPIVTVHGPDGPRPPVRRGGPIMIAGKTVDPLGPVGVHVPRSGSAVGQALERDAPVDRRTGKPVVGVVAGASPGSPLDGTVVGWRPVAAPVRTGAEVTTGNRVGRGERGTGVASPGLPVRVAPGTGIGVAAPVVAAPVRTESVPAPVPAPVRVEPGACTGSGSCDSGSGTGTGEG